MGSRVLDAPLPAAAPGSDYDRSIKPRMVEEPLDLWFYRPLGYALVRVLRHTPITPNMVSLGSIAAAAAAAWFFVDPTVRGASLGTLFLIASALLDSVDGQLARVTGRFSPLGRVIDGMCDAGAFFFLHASVLASLSSRHDVSMLLLIPFGLVTGTLQSFQTAMPDFTRLLLLDLGYGQRNLEAEEPETLRRRFEEARTQGAGWFRQYQLYFLWGYARRQRTVLASSARLRLRVRDVLSRRPEIEPEFARLYREANEPMFRWWSLLALNSYQIALIVAAFTAVLAPPGIVREVGIGWFLVYIWLLNVPLLLLVRKQSRLDRGLEIELSRLEARAGA